MKKGGEDYNKRPASSYDQLKVYNAIAELWKQLSSEIYELRTMGLWEFSIDVRFDAGVPEKEWRDWTVEDCGKIRKAMDKYRKRLESHQFRNMVISRTILLTACVAFIAIGFELAS